MSNPFLRPLPLDCAHASPVCWRCERAWLHERVELLTATVRVHGTPEDTTSLAFAQAWLRDQRTGADCPCCRRPTAGPLYQRSLYAGLCAGIVRLARCPERWIHLSGYLSRWGDAAGRGGDYPKLRFWGLIARGTPADPAPATGYYRVTDLGHEFAKGRVAIPRYVWLRDGEPVPPEELVGVVDPARRGDTLTIHQLLAGAGLELDALWRAADPATMARGEPPLPTSRP